MTDLYTCKMRALFRCLDLNQDGRLTVEDFHLLGDSFVKEGGLEGKDAEIAREHLMQGWRSLETTTEGSEIVTVEDFIHCLKGEQLDMDTMVEYTTNRASMWFDIIDTDHDSCIQFKEFQTFYKILGVKDHSFAKEAFDMVDTDKDGLLSKEEWVNAYVEFWTSNEDTPSKIFYGPLID